MGACPPQAFTRTAQLEPDNGEAWNNIAAIHMQAGRCVDAPAAQHPMQVEVLIHQSCTMSTGRCRKQGLCMRCLSICGACGVWTQRTSRGCLRGSCDSIIPQPVASSTYVIDMRCQACTGAERPGGGGQVPPGLLADLVQLRGGGGAGRRADAGAQGCPAGERPAMVHVSVRVSVRLKVRDREARSLMRLLLC